MKLWAFVFCQPVQLQSARVAAPNKAVACMTLAALLPGSYDLAQPRLGCDCILQFAGYVNEENPRIMSVVSIDGREYLNEDPQ